MRGSVNSWKSWTWNYRIFVSIWAIAMGLFTLGSVILWYQILKDIVKFPVSQNAIWIFIDWLKASFLLLLIALCTEKNRVVSSFLADWFWSVYMRGFKFIGESFVKSFKFHGGAKK